MSSHPSAKVILRMIFLLSMVPAFAQAHLDPVQVDPQHFKVEYEDASIRVLRFRLGPGEKAPMHDRAAASVVNLNNSKVRLSFADGSVREAESTAGSVEHSGPMRLSIENIGGGVVETISTEFKDQGYIAKAQPETQIARAPAATATAPATTPTTPPQKNQVPMAPARPMTVENAPPEPRQVAPVAPALQRETPEGVVKAVTVNGAELAYIDRGQGPVVILLHDTLGDYRSWSNTFEALSRHFRVISYSRRYHYPNYSNGKERDYNFQQNEKDLADFIRTLNLGAVDLVGAGYGASLSAAVAEKNPELVRSVVLVDPDFAELLPASRAEAARSTREEIYHIVRKPLNKGQTDSAIETYFNWGRGTDAWKQSSADLRSQNKQNANALKAQTYDAPSAGLSCADFRKIKSPVLLVSGELAPPNARDISTSLGLCLANGQTLRVPKRDYVGYNVDTGALLRFLSKR